uniref:response regulator n=1 Tax=Trichocoleus desertorum TaxID=1481672 RepID=UPI0025B3741F|nr:response regulator [Trichocoleus desertorum]
MSSNLGYKATILAVDDSVVMQELIKRVLAVDYRVLVSDSAVDALSVLGREKVALLLLDVSMPGIDGLEFCRTVRKLPQFAALPIIMLTARDRAFDKVQGRLAGASEYLTKPFDAAQLRQLIQKFVGTQASGNTN